MNPASRRRVYLTFAPVGWLVIPFVWIMQQQQSEVIRFTYPFLAAYLVAIWVLLYRYPGRVVAIERSTFWMVGGFWLASLAIRVAFAHDPESVWRGLSPSVFMGLTIAVVMAFLWFDTGAALRNALILVVGSTVIGLLYFSPHPGRDDAVLIDFVRYEIYLAITTVFVYALARSKDALLRTKIEADQMRTMAYRDPLTGLDNRRHALDELDRLAADGAPVAVALLDLDEFKTINDQHGHDVGDEALVAVADVLRSANAAVTARWGGEEFLLVFAADQFVAAGAADRVRAALAEMRTPTGLRVTASIGVAGLLPGWTVTDLLRVADDRLYRAKSDGRNLVRGPDPASGRLVD